VEKQGTEAATKPFHMPICVFYFIIVAFLCSANPRRRPGGNLVGLSAEQRKASCQALQNLPARFVGAETAGPSSIGIVLANGQRLKTLDAFGWAPMPTFLLRSPLWAIVHR
jgi:hypothetical protein